MGGGLLQLVAYGAQDVYLTGNPQITFFKVVYRRHTNFALESIQQTFNGSVGYGQRVTATISRNGDLISRAYLVLGVSDTSADTTLCPYFGLRVIKTAEVEIGGQKIDKHYADWMYIWNELSLPYSKKEGYFKMVGGSGSIGDKKVKNTITSSSLKLSVGGDDVSAINNANGFADKKVKVLSLPNQPGFGLELNLTLTGTSLTYTVSKAGANYDTSKSLDFEIKTADLFEQTTQGTPVTVNTSTAMPETFILTLPASDFEVMSTSDNKKDLNTLYVPLEFWFCRNVGLALPLIALQYHEVKINVQFEDAKKCTNGSNDVMPTSTE